jgi:thioredoxin-related protein
MLFMKRITVLVALLLGVKAFSQDMTKFHLYKPEEKAEKEIAKAVSEAKQQGKHVLVQIGGNWCIWCARFHDFITSDPKIDSIVKADYVVYHMNYSEENFNAKALAKYGYPQRFGFPVFLVLDADGKLIETVNSWYLEDGKKSYDRDKVIEFLTDWAPAALDPKQYKEH